MGKLIDKDKDGLRWFGRLPGNDLGDSLTDVFLLLLAQCTRYPDVHIRHFPLLLSVRLYCSDAEHDVFTRSWHYTLFFCLGPRIRPLFHETCQDFRGRY